MNSAILKDLQSLQLHACWAKIAQILLIRSDIIHFRLNSCDFTPLIDPYTIHVSSQSFQLLHHLLCVIYIIRIFVTIKGATNFFFCAHYCVSPTYSEYLW